MIETLTHKDPWATMLKNGIILWRPCFNSANGMQIDEKFQFEPTERLDKPSYFLARLNFTPGTLWESEVIPNRCGENPDGTPRFMRGIVLFVDIMPPQHWTHLIISGVGPVFQMPGRQGLGACVFAKVPTPYNMDDYVKFRQKLYEAKRHELQAPIERAVEISSEIWPDGAREHEKRLIIQPSWAHDSYYNYSLISYQDTKQEAQEKPPTYGAKV